MQAGERTLVEALAAVTKDLKWQKTGHGEDGEGKGKDGKGKDGKFKDGKGKGKHKKGAKAESQDTTWAIFNVHLMPGH